MKYPIGIQDFEKIIEGGYVYLDKTDLVYDLVQNGKIYLLCRPRRFGKSLLVSTLKCYFAGKKELFKGLSIDKLEKEWKQYPVYQLTQQHKERSLTSSRELEDLHCCKLTDLRDVLYPMCDIQYFSSLAVFALQRDFL